MRNKETDASIFCKAKMIHRDSFYEAYDSNEEAANHKTTEHHLQWRATVADWMEEPRKGVAYHSIAP